jgi:hypothetical protein
MAQTIKLRRSATTGNVPTTAQLALGEVALNTFDGRAFIKKDNGAESIEHLITTNSETTGSINLIGNITASGDISASGKLFISTSDAAGSSYSTLMVDTNTGKVYHTGSYGGGGGTSITGTDTHVLFFDGDNTPAGDAGFTYNKTTNSITAITNITSSGNISASGAGTHILGGDLDVYGRVRSLGSNVTLENGNITASADISASGKLYSNDALIKTAFTASATGSTNPSDFIPVSLGGTYSPATLGVSETLSTATTDVDVSNWAPLNNVPWPTTSTNQTIIIQADLPDNYAEDTIVRILAISASGDLDGNDVPFERLQNLSIYNSTLLISQFGNDSNTAGGSTWVPCLELNTTTGTAVAASTVNSNANTFTYGPWASLGAGDWTTIFPGTAALSGNKLTFQLQVHPSVSDLNLRFKIEYLASSTTVNNDHSFGKGLSVGDIPNNYAAEIHNISRDNNQPNGLAVTLGRNLGQPTNNSTFIDFFMSNGLIYESGFDPGGLSKLGSIYPIDINSFGAPTGLALGNLSDKRLKENITYSDQGLNEIKKIKLRNFNWKGSKDTQIGFVAQELYKVIPEAVRVGSKGKKGLETNPWMVSENKIIPYLVGAIQQQQQMIDNLQKEVNFLKKKNK